MAKITSSIGLFANPDHNSTENIQGGTATERYHLTKEEIDLVREIASISQDKNFVFEQNIPSNSWSFSHPLQKITSITILDSAGTEVEGSVTHTPGSSHILIEFSNAFSGTAILN